MSAGSGSMQRAHAVQGAQMHVGTAVLHQELGQVQVALLAGQVQRGGAAACPPVHAAVEEGEVQRALGQGHRVGSGTDPAEDPDRGEGRSGTGQLQLPYPLRGSQPVTCRLAQG